MAAIEVAVGPEVAAGPAMAVEDVDEDLVAVVGLEAVAVEWSPLAMVDPAGTNHPSSPSLAVWQCLAVGLAIPAMEAAAPRLSSAATSADFSQYASTPHQQVTAVLAEHFPPAVVLLAAVEWELSRSAAWSAPEALPMGFAPAAWLMWSPLAGLSPVEPAGPLVSLALTP